MLLSSKILQLGRRHYGDLQQEIRKPHTLLPLSTEIRESKATMSSEATDADVDDYSA
ncbi:rCG42987 [Rattus norvegicus]|uniref:RCG42987 n=1 Tax=Rattus norvegicus TaxID=10116 RepID=A6IW97_RAT|nr:rCG42987 [Rattus norvegicus]